MKKKFIAALLSILMLFPACEQFFALSSSESEVNNASSGGVSQEESMQESSSNKESSIVSGGTSYEEESGSEASAKELVHMIQLVEGHRLPAVFTERNGSVSAASVICAETGISSFSLDTAMGTSDYFKAMETNILTLKEALQ
jgi:hypothetical protein